MQHYMCCMYFSSGNWNLLLAWSTQHTTHHQTGKIMSWCWCFSLCIQLSKKFKRRILLLFVFLFLSADKTTTSVAFSRVTQQVNITGIKKTQNIIMLCPVCPDENHRPTSLLQCLSLRQWWYGVCVSKFIC